MRRGPRLPDPSPGAERRRERSAPFAAVVTLAALVTGAAACGSASPAPAPFQPDFAGCAALRDDGVCEITPTHLALRVVVDDSPEAVDARLDGKPLEVTTEASAGAHRITVVLPEAAAAPGAPATLTLDLGPPAARRRFTLRTEGARTDERIERARALAAEGKRDEARAALGDPDSHEAPFRGRARGRLARLDLADARVDRAIQGLGRSVGENLSAGRLSDAVLDSFVLAYTLSENGRPLDDARAALARVDPAIARWPEGRAQLPYYEALIALGTGDARTVLRRLEAAERAAARLALDAPWRAAVQVRAKALQALGRPDEALRALDAAALATPPTAPVCERARLDATRAWVELSILLASRAPPAPSAALRARIQQLIQVFTRDCPRPTDVQDELVNLAILELLAGNTQAAAAHLAAARATPGTPLASVAAWMLELDGRILLADGRPREAAPRFEELAERAEAAGDPETQWRALLGIGRARLAAGERTVAVEALQRAERALDRWSTTVPLMAGRARFLGDRDASARALVDALLTAGKPEAALDAARTARARALASDARVDRAGSLPAPARARWEAALARYERARRAIDAAAEDDWTLARARLEEARGKRRALLADADRALDDALSELSRVPGGQAGARPAPPEGTLLLTVFERAATGHVLLAHDGHTVTSHPLPEPAGLSPESLSAALLAPLGALVPVAYGLDLGGRGARTARGSAVVVSDPAEDLPQAAREGARVTARLGEGRKVTALRGAEARKPALAEALRGAEIFHFAGHGVFEEEAQWDSGLLIAGGRLVPGDVLALSPAPRLVVLSGCETGRAPARLGVDMSLAYAFLAAGSEAVVATSRPVADSLAAAMSEAFYRDVATPGWDPVAALRRAGDQVRAATPGADWASYRVLVR